MSSTQYNVDDVVLLRLPFRKDQGWRVTKVFPSLEPDLYLHRCQLLKPDGTEDQRVQPISVGPDFIKETIGRFPQWRKTGSKK